MTMTATPHPSDGSSAPRVRLDLDAGVGGKFLGLEITRDGRRLRSQPPAGVQTTFVDDYEAPFGRTINYAATGQYIPGAATPAFSTGLDRMIARGFETALRNQDAMVMPRSTIRQLLNGG